MKNEYKVNYTFHLISSFDNVFAKSFFGAHFYFMGLLRKTREGKRIGAHNIHTEQESGGAR
jgi:hypothetical protein